MTLFQSPLRSVCLQFKCIKHQSSLAIFKHVYFYVTPLKPHLNFDTGKSYRDINYNYFNQIWNFPVRPRVTQLQFLWVEIGSSVWWICFTRNSELKAILSHTTHFIKPVSVLSYEKSVPFKKQGHWFVFLPILRI